MKCNFNTCFRFASVVDCIWTCLTLGKAAPKDYFLIGFGLAGFSLRLKIHPARVLIDCHKPFGVHVHFDDGPQEPVTAETLDDVREFFATAIKKHFGADVEV